MLNLYILFVFSLSLHRIQQCSCFAEKTHSLPTTTMTKRSNFGYFIQGRFVPAQPKHAKRRARQPNGKPPGLTRDQFFKLAAYARWCRDYGINSGIGCAVPPPAKPPAKKAKPADKAHRSYMPRLEGRPQSGPTVLNKDLTGGALDKVLAHATGKHWTREADAEAPG